MSDAITKAIAKQAHLLALYNLIHDIERGHFQMSRLGEKLAKAAGVAGRQTSKIEARADAIIARETVIEQRTDQVFAPHEALLTEAEKGLDDVERQLALVTNSDPLASSKDITETNQVIKHPGLTR